MAHEKHPEIAELVWAGKHAEATEAAYRAYKADPENLVMYASTLYSARLVGPVHARLEGLADLLIEKIPTLSKPSDADALDVISTVLLWTAENTTTPSLAEKAALAATEAAQYGLELAYEEPVTKHAYALLLLTYSQTLFRLKKAGADRAAFAALRECGERAALILDANQQARVYRKLAYLYYTKRRYLRTAWFLVRMKCVRGVAPDVKAKNPI